jgi:hypothetical protein
MTAPATTCMRANGPKTHEFKCARHGAGRRAQRRSPSSRGRPPATLRSNRLSHPNRSNTFRYHLRTSIGCSLAIPRTHLPRNHLGSPNPRAQKHTSPRARRRCGHPVASPTTPGHLLRQRRPRKTPKQDPRRWRRLRKKWPRRVPYRKANACMKTSAIGDD